MCVYTHKNVRVGYEPHAHLLFAYEFFAKPDAIAGNRWKKEKSAARHNGDTPSPRPSPH
jgi:hypothetical protein